ncbi:TIGR03826 family flagellar region protein [Paenibacillus silviterrae]|uniref:TIGR03826 family flagellar region protein n=1 Tax=Paenibacillus silviterrae TaxID=3242194 RepID=UPI00254369F7|nr:TIGR03826 family flagellar region protein [Paenibacillus chinjuensis]
MSLNVANCYRCGKVFMKNHYGVCPNCIKDIEQQYEKCLKYLRENKQCSLQELSEATEVSVTQITKFIREGRISIKHNPNMSFGCEVCGTSIREGTICEPCRSRLAKDVSNLQEDQQKRQANQANRGPSFQIKDRLHDK